MHGPTSCQCLTVMWCKIKPWKFCTSRASLSASKKRKYTMDQISHIHSPPPPPSDCSVRTNHKNYVVSIKWWYSVIDILVVTAWISKLLYSWLFIDPSEHGLYNTDIKIQLLVKSSLHNVNPLKDDLILL